MRTVLFALLATTTACAALMHSMTPTPRVVENPLTSGQPLEVTKKGDVDGAMEADCTVWPFEDKLTVTVTAGQICVEQHRHKAAPVGWTGEPTMNSSDFVSVANDAGEGGSIAIKPAHSAKVGSCFNRGFNGNTPIWAFDYKGCAPNNGTITAATKSVRVGDESWTFPAGAPSGSGAPGATAAR